jgi:hypothetical protein
MIAVIIPTYAHLCICWEKYCNHIRECTERHTLTQFIFAKCFNKNVNNSNTNNVATQSNLLLGDLSRHDVASRATPIPTFRRNITSSKRREQIIHYRRHKAQKNGILICNIYQNFITHIWNALIYLLLSHISRTKHHSNPLLCSSLKKTDSFSS